MNLKTKRAPTSQRTFLAPAKSTNSLKQVSPNRENELPFDNEQTNERNLDGPQFRFELLRRYDHSRGSLPNGTQSSWDGKVLVDTGHRFRRMVLHRIDPGCLDQMARQPSNDESHRSVDTGLGDTISCHHDLSTSES